MSLQDLGNIGEFAGAFAVLASLVYLALQIRQNTQAVRASIQQENRQSIAEFYTLLTNPETARIWRLGLQNPLILEENDAVSFHALLSVLFSHFETAFHRRLLPHIHDIESDPAREVAIRGLTRTPGFEPWWSVYRHVYSREFRQYVEELRKGAAQHADEAHVE